MPKLFKLRSIFFIFLTGLILSGCSTGSHTVEGTIIDYKTLQPIAGAKVTISKLGWGFRNGSLVWDKIYAFESLTDNQGLFSVEVKGNATDLRATKEGYINYQGWHDSNQFLQIKLKASDPNYTPLPSSQIETGFKNFVPYGWIFADNTTTSNLSKADLFTEMVNDDPDHIVLKTSEPGGIAFLSAKAMGVNSDYLVYSDTAPDTGYVTTLDLNLERGKESPAGVYFVRTHDGSHYAKFYFGPSGYGLLGSEQERQQGTWGILFTYVYDPSGSRNLEYQNLQ